MSEFSGGILWQIKSGYDAASPSLVLLVHLYDANGNLTSIRDWKLGLPQYHDFTYDDADRLLSASATNGTNDTGEYGPENYSYDNLGRLEAKHTGNQYDYGSATGEPLHGVERVYDTIGSTKTIQIRARSTVCDDGVGATMELWVNGTKIQTWTNVSTSWTTYSKNTTVTGRDVIDVVFTNDCYQGGKDRNLYVDYVTVDGQTVQAEGGAALLDKGSGSAAFDDQDMYLGQEPLWWNGAIRLAVGEGAFAGGYDANGNLTSRVVDGLGQLLTYDVENRLVQVATSTSSASFVYDGDGRRVKATIAGVEILYVGNYLEWDAGAGQMLKYYYAGGQRVAMRDGAGVLSYLFGDHLGSTTVIANASGVQTGALRYKAWGEDRYSSGTAPTDRKYTGQIEEAYINLYWYGSRWYDPILGRFTQPDTIVPEPYNPEAYDRFSYVYNNPANYIDPTGHVVECGPIPENCGGAGPPPLDPFENSDVPFDPSLGGNNEDEAPPEPPNPPLTVLVPLIFPITGVVVLSELALMRAEITLIPFAASMPQVGVPLELVLLGASAAILDFEVAYVVYVYRVASNPDQKQEFELFPPWGLDN